MHGYYGHTLKMVNDKGEWVYAQFHMISDQGTENFTADEAAAAYVCHFLTLNPADVQFQRLRTEGSLRVYRERRVSRSQSHRDGILISASHLGP